MPIYKSKTPTKDGRCYFYKVSYVDIFGRQQSKVSKKYRTKSEAKMAESEFMTSDLDINKTTPADMTFRDLYSHFLEYQDDKVRLTTKRNYEHKIIHLESFMDVKCKDFNIAMYEEWKKQMNANPNLGTNTKNDILKFFKSILNYGITWHNLNFMSTYRKITNFTNPNELRKEMEFYTYEEFQQFISCADDLRYKCLFETLYYCGLRCGEARGLTWRDIDFSKKKMKINKQVQNKKTERVNEYYIAAPKTRDSNRVLPICDELLEHLSEYKNELSKFRNFNDSMFIFGEDNGIRPFDPKKVRIVCKKIADNADLKHIRLHDFRHSCASLLINSGASVTMVAKYLGHTKIDVTLNTYTHMFQSALDGVLDIINNLDTESE